MKNMKISTRLAGAFALLVLVIVALGATTAVLLGSVKEQVEGVLNDRYPKTVQLNEIKGHINQGARSMRNTLLMSDPAMVQKEFETIAAGRAAVTGIIEKLQANSTARGKEQIDGMVQARAKYAANQDKFLGLVKAGKDKEARALLFGELRPAQMAYFEQVDKVLVYQGAQMVKASTEATAAIATVFAATIGGVVLAMVIAGVMAWWIIRSITRPLNRAVEASRAVSRGDLTVDLTADGRDEVSQLLGAMRTMQGKLSEVVMTIQRGADSVASAASQISQGNNDLSGRTEEQASALEQTSASMKQLSGTVRQNADSADQGNRLAAQASEVAARGGEVVGEVVQTMKGINESSRKISDIIGVIDGIAFQTNILALNAAVEAARAGEQGRGFAVVAGEVRTLAQRSADAAREIKGLIETSVQRVEQGSELVNRAGTTMEEVVQSIREVSDIMGRISQASTEQSAGVAQVGEAVTQMDQTTQQNAALVEQSAAAAESLKAQAHQLVNAVAIFRLQDSANGPMLAAA